VPLILFWAKTQTCNNSANPIQASALLSRILSNNHVSQNPGDAYGFDHMTFHRRTASTGYANPKTEDELNRFNQNRHVEHRSANMGRDFSHRFGIIRQCRVVNDYGNTRLYRLKLQVKGLVYCRVLMYAYATSCGPPIDSILADDFGNYYRPYPVSNWYGCCDIISVGPGVALESNPNLPHAIDDMPGIYECLIDLG